MMPVGKAEVNQINARKHVVKPWCMLVKCLLNLSQASRARVFIPTEQLKVEMVIPYACIQSRPSNSFTG
jgi:hypothetical protein